MTVDCKLELVLIPVSDADRAKRFYVEQAGFDLPGPDPDRANYMSFAEFTDPDGNLWLLQEVRRDPQGQEGDDR